MPNLIDLTGKRFGRLVVVDRAPTKIQASGQRKTMWNCVCDCGARIITQMWCLRSGMSKSCGCFHRDSATAQSTVHGMSGTPEHVVWAQMRERCRNPNSPSWENYGGRGISVCDRWQEFANFFADMGQRPSPKHSLERLDVNRGYEIGNCVWATKKTQARNTRRNHYITFNGETRCVAEWSELTGIGGPTIRFRLKEGWTVERALTTPAAPIPPRRNGHLTFGGETMSVAAWARRYGMDRNTLHMRLTKYGWPLERALTEPVRR